MSDLTYNVTVSMSGGAPILDGVFVVTGVDLTGATDSTSFCQAAIDLAEASGGGTVYFPAGTYRIDTGLHIDSDNIWIQGAGIGATIVGWQDGNGAGGDNSNGDYIFTVSDCDNIKFSDLSLTNGPSEDIGDNNSPNAGGIISAAGVTKLKVRDCYFFEIGGTYGLVIRKCHDVKVAGCTFYMISYAGMMIIDTCSDIKVTNSTFDTTNSANVGRNRYLFATAPDEIFSNDATNLYFLKDLLVDGCTFKNNAVWEGIDSHGGDRMIFTNNTITGCYIGMNIICTTSGGNDYVQSPSMDDVLINNNTILADGVASPLYGIVVRGHDTDASSPWSSSNMVVSENTVIGYGGPSTDFIGAITAYRLKDVSIKDNYIDDFAQTGVMLYHSLDGVVVSGNTIREAGSTHLYADRVSGVTVRSATAMTDVLIDGNRFIDAAGDWDYGIYAWSGTGSNGIVIGGNEYLDLTSSWTADISPVAGTWARKTTVGAVEIHEFAGTPNTSLTAPKGSLCMDYTNAVLYINTDGSTAWSAV